MDADDPEQPEPREPARSFRVRPVVQPSRRDADDDRTVSRDETDVGWGDAPGERDDAWYRRERPPHHE